MWAGYAIPADSFRNVLENRFSINVCFDMSEMFVSSLWEGDFDELFTVMFCVFLKEEVG